MNIRISWTRIYEPLPKDPTAKVERKVQKLLSKHKTALLIDLKRKLTPPTANLHICMVSWHSSEPLASSIGSPRYALAGFLRKILRPLAGKSESFIKNLGNFVQLLKSVNVQSIDTLVSFDVSLLTNAPVDEALQVISNKLHNDDTLAEWSALQGEAIMELGGLSENQILSDGYVLPTERWHCYG
jgi:hypothetical protein